MATVKLGDIAIEAKSSNKGDKTGIRIVGLEHLTPSNVTLSSWSEDTENTFTKEFSKGDVLFGRRRAYLKKAAVAPFDGICSGDITVIRAIEDKVDPDLLPFIIQNDFLFDFAVGKSAGSLSPRVKWTHLKEFTIDLPSMPEQSKLAETLWSINETKNAYEDLINKTDELVKSQFIEMFGSVDENTGLVSGSDYKFVKLGALTSIKTGKLDANAATGGEYPFFSCSSETLSIDTYSYDCECVLVAGNGEFNVKYYNGKFDAYQRTYIIQSTNDRLSVPFLYRFMGMYVDRLKRQSIGTVIKYIKLGNLTDALIPLPPIDIQEQFVYLAEQSDKSKFALQEAIKDLDALSKKIIAENLIPAGKE